MNIHSPLNVSMHAPLGNLLLEFTVSPVHPTALPVVDKIVQLAMLDMFYYMEDAHSNVQMEHTRKEMSVDIVLLDVDSAKALVHVKNVGMSTLWPLSYVRLVMTDIITLLLIG
jgi:hypothetical protein